MNSMNSYVPKSVPKDLPWYERDGLMTWYNQTKCEDFLRDTNKHFQEAKESILTLFIDNVMERRSQNTF